MSPDAVRTVQKIFDFCRQQRDEAEKALHTGQPSPGIWVGRKSAYNHVLQVTSALLLEDSQSTVTPNTKPSGE